MTEQELLNQNNDTFRDENSDAWKLRGKIRSAEVRAFNINIFAWVKSLLTGKADLVEGKVPLEQLPEIGTTINSTDDIANEGAVNKWFTDARVYLAKTTNYVIQGTTRAITQNDTLGMILGIFENRLNTLGQSITNLTNSLANYVQKPGSGAITPVSGVLTLPISKDGVYKCGAEANGVTTWIHPTSIQFSGTPYDGMGVVCKIKSNGSVEPTFTGLTRHNDSRKFNTDSGTLNSIRIFWEPNSNGVLTGYYIWTQQ